MILLDFFVLSTKYWSFDFCQYIGWFLKQYFLVGLFEKLDRLSSLPNQFLKMKPLYVVVNLVMWNHAFYKRQFENNDNVQNN